MPKRYLVLDQNKLSAPDVDQLLRTSSETHFVLPDVAFVELTKNPARRAFNVSATLEKFAPFRSRIHIAKAISSTLDFELTKGKSGAEHMIHAEATHFVGNLLSSLVAGVDGPEMQRIRTDPDDHHGSLVKDYFDHPTNKENVAELVDTMKDWLPASLQKDLRANRISNGAQLDIIHTRAPTLLLGLLQGHAGMSVEKAWFFMKRNPVILRWYYSKMWLCIDWIKSGGFDNVNAEKISNDLIDHSYVITATCFTGFLSTDKRAMAAYQDMTKLLSKSASRQ